MTRRRGQWIALAAAAMTLCAGVRSAPGAEAETKPEATDRSDPETRLIPSAKTAQALEDREQRRVKSDGNGAGGGWWKMPLALAVVVVLILALRHLLRRLGARRQLQSVGPMQVLARVAVSQRQQLVLVRLGRRLVLLGSGPAGLAALTEVTDSEEIADLERAASESHGGAFASLLKRKIARRGSEADDRCEAGASKEADSSAAREDEP